MLGVNTTTTSPLEKNHKSLQTQELLKDPFTIIKSFLRHPQPFSVDGFTSSNDSTFDYIHQECTVLVIGAGGLGCEILKCLVLSGFTKIDVIDLDTVETTNLNRQFLFRHKDIGRYKSHVASEYINTHFSYLGVTVTPHIGRIQDQPSTFYDYFNIIITGLDNIEARRWINSLIHSLIIKNKETGCIELSSIKPLFDGGTEGFKGQCRTILPSLTSCFECSLESFPPQTTYPLCTLSDTPRLPEHCIEYALLVEWDNYFPNKPLDVDQPETLDWIYCKALERATLFKIEGITSQLVNGVVKRIIPAIASTNALIAATLVAEAFKLSTYCGPVVNNYLMYMGQSGIYTYTFNYQKTHNCIVCGTDTRSLSVSRLITLDQLIDKLQHMAEFQLKKPSISSQKAVVFIQNPPLLRQQHEYKLSWSLQRLIDEDIMTEGEELTVTDPLLVVPLKLYLHCID